MGKLSDNHIHDPYRFYTHTRRHPTSCAQTVCALLSPNWHWCWCRVTIYGDLEAGKPTLRLEQVLRVIDALGAR